MVQPTFVKIPSFNASNSNNGVVIDCKQQNENDQDQLFPLEDQTMPRKGANAIANQLI